MRARRRARCITAVALVIAVAAACSADGSTSSDKSQSPARELRIASYDFDESVLLAQMYAVALRDKGFRVQVVPNLGSREVVDPALIQGAVDVIPEYVGTALNFIEGDTSTTTDSATAYKHLRAAFADKGVVTLHYAAAQDRNGFAVNSAQARRHGWTRISDLASDSASLVFGGPPECAERDLCLKGLQDTYGLRFKQFRPYDDQSVTAQALLTGEIGVGLLDTTNGALSNHRLLLLNDDRHLQPAENVVPVVSRAAYQRAGPKLAAILDAVSAKLTTSDLVAMNRAVDVNGSDPAVVATRWLRQKGLLTGPN